MCLHCEALSETIIRILIEAERGLKVRDCLSKNFFDEFEKGEKFK